jgi:endo-1,4-beta-xylanase
MNCKIQQLVLSIAMFSTAAAAVADEPQLKDVFAGKFRVGVALGTEQVMGNEPESLALVQRHYNTITPENLLKWESVHPQPDQYNFEPVDRYVEFGEKNGMFIVGHTLVWHNQTPDWVFEDDQGNPLDREALVARMRDHIHTVVGRYKGRIKAWDVVNEAILAEDGEWRKTKWYEIIGPEYVEMAFQFAHEADPDAELYYNDYNEWKPGAREGINKLIRNLQAKGIRIDGLGLQGHWGMDYPSVEEIEAMLDDYGQLGIKLMITELDLNILPFPDPSQHGADITLNYELKKELDPYHDGLPDDVSQKVNRRYAELFEIFLKHSDKIDRVTFWGVHDGHSWLNYWPITGRTAYPLLFDRELKPKPVFDAVIQTANEE